MMGNAMQDKFVVAKGKRKKKGKKKGMLAKLSISAMQNHTIGILHGGAGVLVLSSSSLAVRDTQYFQNHRLAI